MRSISSKNVPHTLLHGPCTVIYHPLYEHPMRTNREQTKAKKSQSCLNCATFLGDTLKIEDATAPLRGSQPDRIGLDSLNRVVREKCSLDSLDRV